jgi:hypothetical protein
MPLEAFTLCGIESELLLHFTLIRILVITLRYNSRVRLLVVVSAEVEYAKGHEVARDGLTE